MGLLSIKDLLESTFSSRWSGALGREALAKDTFILQTFEQEKPWGMDCAIDLLDCNPDSIRSFEVIRAFTVDLCDRINMRRFGDPILVDFGDEPRVSGITLVQLIQTSDITGHFINQTNAACLNIFSCSPYSPYQTAAICQQWFEAQEVQLSVVFRGPQEGRARLRQEKEGE